MRRSPMQVVAHIRKQKGSMPGEPWRVMHSNCVSKIKRIRQTLPFPLERKQFMHAVLPPFYKETPEWLNLGKSIEWGRLVNFELEGMDPEYSFWIKTDEMYPVPKDISDPFILYESNKYRPPVEDWVRACFELHDDMESTADRLTQFLSRAKHPQWVKKYWPELLPFIGDVNKISAEYIEPDPRCMFTARVEESRNRREVENMLAKCAMLDDFECTAWVAHDID